MVILWVSQILLDYYTTLTTKDAAGTPIHFGAQAKIGGGQIANYSGQGQQVALFSSRGPDVEDFNFNQADVLKPNVLAPGYLIWGAWTPIGIDNPNYMGELHCKTYHAHDIYYCSFLTPVQALLRKLQRQESMFCSYILRSTLLI
jgi:hypothetical protein